MFQGRLETQGDRHVTKLLKPKSKCLTAKDAQYLHYGFSVGLSVCLFASLSGHHSRGSNLLTLSFQALQLLNALISIF